jgi:hypothetical protein
MSKHLYSTKNCNITKDLLFNCVEKSKQLDECALLKYIVNKYCLKENTIHKSFK